MTELMVRTGLVSLLVGMEVKSLQSQAMQTLTPSGLMRGLAGVPLTLVKR